MISRVTRCFDLTMFGLIAVAVLLRNWPLAGLFLGLMLQNTLNDVRRELIQARKDREFGKATVNTA